MKFGDEITNVCAGDKNPRRHSYYVCASKRNVKCTNKEGEFWETSKEVIFAGHLSYEECEKLYEPIWQQQYGKLKEREG